MAMTGAGTFWDDRSVFVTGATGLIGSWLVRDLLRAGARVSALVKDHDPQSELFRSGSVNQISIVSGRLEDFRTVEEAIGLHEPDVVFHLGAQTLVTVAYRSPLGTFESNIRGTYNLLEACRRHRECVNRIVVASTDKAYGSTDVLPYSEDMPLDGLDNPYDASKLCTDVLARSYFRSYDVPVTVTRFGNVYGGGDLNWDRIVPGTIRSHLAGRPVVLRSDGTFTRDYLFVEDVAAGYMRLAEKMHDSGIAGESFNFSTESPVSVLDIVGMIREKMDCMHLEPDIRATAKAEIRDQHLSAEKARRLLGWAPEHTLSAGLDRAIDWYTRFLSDADTSRPGSSNR